MSLKKKSLNGRIRRIVEEQKTSHLTISSYCRKKKIPLSTFYYWRQRLDSDISLIQKKTDPGFIQVKISADEKKAVSDETIVINFPAGSSMKVPCTPIVIKELFGVIQKTEGIYDTD